MPRLVTKGKEPSWTHILENNCNSASWEGERTLLETQKKMVPYWVGYFSVQSGMFLVEVCNLYKFFYSIKMQLVIEDFHYFTELLTQWRTHHIVTSDIRSSISLPNICFSLDSSTIYFYHLNEVSHIHIFSCDDKIGPLEFYVHFPQFSAFITHWTTIK